MIGEGPGGALDQARPAAVHADRRDHARGPADRAAARPLRHRAAAGVLRRRRARRASCCARRSILGIADRRGRRRARSRTASRGTPRIANRLLRRVRDFAQVQADGRDQRRTSRTRRWTCSRSIRRASTRSTAAAADHHREVRRRPGRRRSLAAALSEERGTLEDVIEPFLIQQGFLMRTARGRIATREGVSALRPAGPERGARHLAAVRAMTR